MGVVCQRVPVGDNPLGQLRIGARHATNGKESGFYAFNLQRVENALRRAFSRTVVEGENDLLGPQAKAFFMANEAFVICGIKHNCAVSAQRIRFASRKSRNGHDTNKRNGTEDG